MKKIITTTLTCLLLLIGFKAAFSQTSSSGNLSANAYSLPFSYGTSMTAYTKFGSSSNPFTRQLTLKPAGAIAAQPAVFAPQSGGMTGMMLGITACDSYPPPCPFGEGNLIIDLGVEYLVMYGLDPASLAASGLQAGDPITAGQYLGTVSASNSFHMEVYVPDVPGQLFDANGQLIRNWVTVTNGRSTYTYDTHNRIPVICNGSQYGPLYHGQFLTAAGCASSKSIEADAVPASLNIYPQPASQTLTFELKGADAQGSTVELIDAQGRSVGTFAANGNYSKIDVSNLKSGIYLYRFASEKLHKSGKVMVLN